MIFSLFVSVYLKRITTFTTIDVQYQCVCIVYMTVYSIHYPCTYSISVYELEALYMYVCAGRLAFIAQYNTVTQ